MAVAEGTASPRLAAARDVMAKLTERISHLSALSVSENLTSASTSTTNEKGGLRGK